MPEREELTRELFGSASRERAQLQVLDGRRVTERTRDGEPAPRDVMKVAFYTGVDQRLDLPVMLPPAPNDVDIAGERVLIADDGSDTAAPLKLVRDFCTGRVAEVVWRHPDKWINFAWSKEAPVVCRTGQVLDA